MTSYPMGSGSPLQQSEWHSSEWHSSGHLHTRNQSAALLRAAIIALALLTGLALIVWL